MTRQDIIQGVYLRLRTPRLGKPAGLIGSVYYVGTDQAGDWYFQLRYLNAPTGARTRAGAQWSLNLHEADLEHFDQINTWGEVQKLLLGPGAARKSRAEELTRSAGKRKAHSNQLRLFDDC